jgi:hypothetical protein
MTFDEAIAEVIRDNPALPEVTDIYLSVDDLFNTKATCAVLIQLQEEKFIYTGGGTSAAIKQVADISVFKKRTDDPGTALPVIASNLLGVFLKDLRLDGFLVEAGRFIDAESGEGLVGGKKADYARYFFAGKYFKELS